MPTLPITDTENLGLKSLMTFANRCSKTSSRYKSEQTHVFFIKKKWRKMDSYPV